MAGHSRREFLKQAAAGTTLLGLEATAAAAPAGLPRRTLGKTGVEVSMLGFGGGSRFLMAEPDDGLRMLEEAVAAGINYFDTAAMYGEDRESEKRYGKVLPRHRGSIFLATKTQDRTHDGALRSVETSLRNLQTDKLDLIQMHDAGPKDDPAAWERPDGALTALRRLQREKVVRLVGFTGHQDAEVHRKIIQSLAFDTVLMALNAAEHKPFRERALPAAVERGMGVIAMKTTRNLVGTGPAKASARDLLSWAWSLPVATVIVGMEGSPVLQDNLRLAREWRPGAVDTAALEGRLRRSVTAEQLGWALPAYRDRWPA